LNIDIEPYAFVVDVTTENAATANVWSAANETNAAAAAAATTSRNE